MAINESTGAESRRDAIGMRDEAEALCGGDDGSSFQDAWVVSVGEPRDGDAVPIFDGADAAFGLRNVGPGGTIVHIDASVGWISKKSPQGSKSGVATDLFDGEALERVPIAKSLQFRESACSDGRRAREIDPNVTDVSRHCEQEDHTVNLEEVRAERHIAMCPKYLGRRGHPPQQGRVGSTSASGAAAKGVHVGAVDKEHVLGVL